MIDRIGVIKIIQWGCVVYLIGNLGTVQVSRCWTLFLFRGMAGIGISMLLCGLLTTIVQVADDRSKNKFMGWYHSFSSLGTFCGAMASGYLCEVISWRAVFFIPTLLIAILYCLAIGWRSPAAGRPSHAVRNDYGGALLLFGWLSLLVTWLSAGGDEWPWFSPIMLTLLGLGIASFAIWFHLEAKHPNPLLNVNLFRFNRNLRNLIALLFVSSLLVGGVKYFVPIYLTQAKNYEPIQIGWLILTYAAARIIASPMVGIFSDNGRDERIMRFGWVTLSLAFLALSACSVFGLMAWPEPVFFMFLVAIGVGSSCINPNATSKLMAGVSDHQKGLMAGCCQMIGVMGYAIGISAFESIYSNASDPSAGCWLTCLIATGISVFCFASVVTRPFINAEAAMSKSDA
jgi:MFS family permease